MSPPGATGPARTRIETGLLAAALEGTARIMPALMRSSMAQHPLSRSHRASGLNRVQPPHMHHLRVPLLLVLLTFRLL